MADGFNTQPPKGGWFTNCIKKLDFTGFNTQPPKGGWDNFVKKSFFFGDCFNTQPPKGGWLVASAINMREQVSTHSRLKAAGLSFFFPKRRIYRFNTQPPKGGWQEKAGWRVECRVSTHSRLKAAGRFAYGGLFDSPSFQHTAA